MPTRTHVTATINGEETEFLCEPRQSLLEVLRDELGLTGAKEGCNNGNCGACSVHPGRPARQLLLRAGRRGRGRDDHDRSKGSRSRAACTRCSRLPRRARRCSAASARPGFIVAAKALLDKNPNPTEHADPLLARGQPLPLHRLRQDHPGGSGRRRYAATGGCRGLEQPDQISPGSAAGLLGSRSHRAASKMVINQPTSLHQRVHRRRAKEVKPAALEHAGKGDRFRSGRLKVRPRIRRLLPV